MSNAFRILIIHFTLLFGLVPLSHSDFESAFNDNPVLLPDLRDKYDQLCGNNTSAQTLDLADLNADGRKDIVVGLWCGVGIGHTSSTVMTGEPTVGAVIALTQNADKTFTDSTMRLFGSEIVTIEKPFENVVYDFNADGYDDIFMTMSREDGRSDPWDVEDNILNAVVMSNGDGTYNLLRTGCTQPCGTGYMVYEVDNEAGGIDVVTSPIGYGGSREVWTYRDTWQNLSTLAGGLSTGAMVFFERTASELGSLRLAVSYKLNGASGVRLLERPDQSTDWIAVDTWITSIESIFSSNVTNWNGDVSVWNVTLSDGKYYAGSGSFEYGCELQDQNDTSLNLVYLETAYELDDYVEGMDLIEGQGMEWVYKLFGFSATDTSLTPVPIILQASVDLTDRPYRLICEDVNSDGRDDIIVSTWGYESHPHVYINTGKNKFSLVREEIWPSMGSALKNAQPVYADADGDDIPDVIYFSGSSVSGSNSSEIRYEIFSGKRLIGPADTYDSDSDGVLNQLDALPLDANETIDTDSDGIGNNADTDDDGDGLADSQEAIYGTNPLLKDSDSDGYSDKDEIDMGTDPLDANSVPSSGLSMILIKAFLDKQKAASQVSAEQRK